MLDFKFQDAAIDAIIEKYHSKAEDGVSWFPVGEALEYAYCETKESAPIRRLLVDLHAMNGRAAWLHKWADPRNIPQPFLLELASKLFDRRNGVREHFDASKYHNHHPGDGTSCLSKYPSSC